MPTRIVQVDAFTAQPFAGNPAAVCVLPAPRAEEWMRNVAREMNLSETAFLHPVVTAEGNGYNLRWLTPAVEVDLCGHATLAAAHVLWEDGHLASDAAARFHTRSGLLTCEKQGDWIEMNFPAKIAEPAEAPAQLAQALGAELKYIGKNQFDYLVEVADETTLRSLNPNHHLLRQLPVRGIIVTARGADYDFVSRFFAPAKGVPEDPVTGSAHCTLIPYWSAKLGKKKMFARQVSARGGEIWCEDRGERVTIAGKAVTYLEGTIVVS